ncbi:MAG TPA: flagellar hook-basal body complex protein FliE [Phycisphaerales bacterium]|nr:flagellar hook-basal body complex protein FliE [Phycisphaerales bacterium]
MTDPLGLIRAGGQVPGMPLRPPGTQGPETGPSFKDLLMQNLKEVSRLEQEATTAIEDLGTGARTDLEGVMLATHKADTAFRMLLAVRNKVQQAYEEIKQVRV